MAVIRSGIAHCGAVLAAVQRSFMIPQSHLLLHLDSRRSLTAASWELNFPLQLRRFAVFNIRSQVSLLFQLTSKHPYNAAQVERPAPGAEQSRARMDNPAEAGHRRHQWRRSLREHGLLADWH
jgi:hypothetical protein